MDRASAIDIKNVPGDIRRANEIANALSDISDRAMTTQRSISNNVRAMLGIVPLRPDNGTWGYAIDAISGAKSRASAVVKPISAAFEAL